MEGVRCREGQGLAQRDLAAVGKTGQWARSRSSVSLADRLVQIALYFILVPRNPLKPSKIFRAKERALGLDHALGAAGLLFAGSTSLRGPSVPNPLSDYRRCGR